MSDTQELTDMQIVRKLFGDFTSARQFDPNSIEYRILNNSTVKKIPEDYRFDKALCAIVRAALKYSNSTFEQVMEEYLSLGEMPSDFKGSPSGYYRGLAKELVKKGVVKKK